MAAASIKHGSFPDHNVAAVFYFFIGPSGHFRSPLGKHALASLVTL